MTRGNKKIGLKEAMAIGIGGMVGGGIFAVLGLAVSISKGGTAFSFLVAGVLALLTSYSYVKLSIAFPDRGGTVNFINHGFGRTVFSGGVNNLLWFSYIIMLSLYASAFGSYATNLLAFSTGKAVSFHIYATGIIVLATVINYFSIKIVGIIEDYAVIIKLIILIAFVALGIYGLRNSVNLQQLSVQNWGSPFLLFTGGMVIFVAYEGFELIANAAPDIRVPGKNIPRAYYFSVIFVILLYLVIAVVTVGSLPFKAIADARDYVLAEAAKPMLGNFGFALIAVAAMISTFSAINASLYGGSRVSYEIAEDDELPHEFTGKIWNHPVGLIITAAVTLIVVNTVNLESISTAGSTGFILVFSLVNYTAFKLSKAVKGNKVITFAGFILGLTALSTLIAQQFSKNRFGAVLAVSIILGCFLVELIYKKNEKRLSEKPESR